MIPKRRAQRGVDSIVGIVMMMLMMLMILPLSKSQVNIFGSLNNSNHQQHHYHHHHLPRSPSQQNNSSNSSLSSFWSHIPSDDTGAFGRAGHPDCPCVQDLNQFFSLDAISDEQIQREQQQSLGDTIDVRTYGWGCPRHDAPTPSCVTVDHDCRNQYPRPAGVCDRSWCQRAWCYVDPTQCSLLQRRSRLFGGESLRFYSYATCGSMDFFTKGNRVATLEGKTLKVGLNSNTGGWMGAYSNDNQHFRGPMERWSGPVVEFLKEAALNGDFTLEITEPPADLRNRSNAFFKSTSSFDFCVYTTALGYVDLCLAQYTVTDIRASTTDLFILESASVFLVAEASNEQGTLFTQFRTSAWKAFAPFTFWTWVFIVFCVVPVFALLIVVHEYGARGSTFPAEEKFVVWSGDDQRELHIKRVPVHMAFWTSLYHTLLSVFLWTWAQPVVTAGAKLNLLGMSFFALTTLVAYTANLAAIFGQSEQHTTIAGLDDAIDKGFRFCCERKNMETITSSAASSRLDPSMFVVDPVALGGDGQPGFICPQCHARARVFQMLDASLADRDANYCHAALAPLEDLEILQARGQHCNLLSVGGPVQSVMSGFPVSHKIAPALSSFLLQMKHEMDKQVGLHRPLSTCPVSDQGEGTPLSIVSLSGIWIVATLFVLAGVFSALAVPCLARHCCRRWEERRQTERRVIKRDQNGNPAANMPDYDDDELTVKAWEQLQPSPRETKKLRSWFALTPNLARNPEEEESPRVLQRISCKSCLLPSSKRDNEDDQTDYQDALQVTSDLHTISSNSLNAPSLDLASDDFDDEETQDGIGPLQLPVAFSFVFGRS